MRAMLAATLLLLLSSCSATPDYHADDSREACTAYCLPHDWSYTTSWSHDHGCTCFGYAPHDAGAAR